jgi:2,4-dienoyl-CoA reductase-like NADH-dependent reductase (Old Yellow Enzyme family)
MTTPQPMKPRALFMAPMTTWSSNPDLTVSEAELAYLRARARNVDYAVTACTFLNRRRQSFPLQFFAGSDAYLDSLTRTAAAIHEGGARAILQVHEPGRMISPPLQGEPGIELVSASAVRPERDGYGTPRALTEAELEAMFAEHHAATGRAIRAGFDGIELHGANTYLPQQFVSPLTNRRTDAYGRDRLRFVRRLVQAVEDARREAGRPDFLIGYRFSPEEKEAGGLRLPHTFELLDHLSSTGIDYLHVSLERYDRPSYFDEGLIVARALLERIAGQKPLVGVGKIRTRADVEAAFRLGFQHVAMGTALLLNPRWADTADPVTQISEATVPHDLPPGMRKMLIEVFSKFP